MSEKVEWKEKKTSLGNAIIISVVALIIGVVVGANFNNIFGGFAPYLGWSNKASSSLDWSSLDEVYNELASSYNGDISENELIEGAKKG